MRTFLFFAIYIAGVVGGAAILARMHGDVLLVAPQAMPAGHVLRNGDLLLAVDGRQYLPRAVEASEIVSAHEIETLETAVRASSAVPIAVRADRHAAFRRNFRSGDELYVCPAGVRAVFRTMFCGADDALCVIIAEVTPADAKKTIAAPPLELREGGTCEEDGDAG